MADSKKTDYVVDNLSVKDYGKRLELKLFTKKPAAKKAKPKKPVKKKPKKAAAKRVSAKPVHKHSVESLKRLIVENASSRLAQAPAKPQSNERLESFLKKVERRIKRAHAKKPKPKAKAKAATKKKKGKKKHHKTRVVVLIESPPQIKKEKAVIRRTLGEIVEKKDSYQPKAGTLVLANRDIGRRWFRFYRASDVPQQFWFLYSVLRNGKTEPSLELIDNYYRIFPFDLESSVFRDEIQSIREMERVAPSPAILDKKPESVGELHELEEGLAVKEVIKFRETYNRYPGEAEFDHMADNIVEQLQKSALEPDETAEETTALLDETPKPRHRRGK